MNRWAVGVAFALTAGCDSGGAPPGADGGSVDAPVITDVVATDVVTTDVVITDVVATDVVATDMPVVADTPATMDVSDVPTATDVPVTPDTPTAIDVPMAMDVVMSMDAGCLLSSMTSGVRPVRVQQFGMSANLAGIDVAAMPCGISVLTTTADTTGDPRARYLLGRPFWFRFTGAGFISAHTQEYNLAGDGLGFSGADSVQMIPTSSVTTQFPGFDASKGHLLVDLGRSNVGTTCSPAAGGYVVTVVGHPEARVIYWRGSTPTPSATSSEPFGRISIENLTPGDFATIEGRSGTCMLAAPRLAAQGYTGRFPIVANAVTFVPMRSITAPVDPDAGALADVPRSGDSAACTTTTVAAGGTAIFVWPPISRPLGGVAVSWIGCGDPLVTGTDPAGLWTMSVPQTMPGYFRNTRAGAYPTLSGELSFPLTLPIPLYLWESAATDALSGQWIPGYDATKAHVFIDINDTTGGCTKVGFVPTVPGHPEAVVRYISGTSGVSGSLTSTNTYGRMVITGLTPGGFVTPTATNGTCHLNFERILQTGRVQLEAGSVTVLNSRAEP